MKETDIVSLLETLQKIPISSEFDLEDFNMELSWILPHQRDSHGTCGRICKLEMDGQLTAMLWNACESVKYMHHRDRKFDKSHQLLVEALQALLVLPNDAVDVK